MFNDKLQPIYDGKVLVNQTAMDNPVVQSVLKEMSLRNFEPQRINNYGGMVHFRQALIMNKQPMYIKGDIMLIAKYNRFDESVEIGDLNNPSDGWVTYDPTQGASSEELTEICNTLYDRCLLAELGIKGFTPAGEQHLIKS